MSLMSFVGFFLILTGFALAVWWVASGRPQQTPMLSVLGLAILTGVVLVLPDRAVEISIKGVGTIKAAAAQAVIDAKQITEMRQRIEAQSATVDLVAKEAAETKKLSEDLSQKNQLAEQKLTEVDQTLKKASESLSELQRTSEFTNTVILAQNDDRKAFDQLKSWANDAANPLSPRALQAWVTILDQHAQPFYRSNFTFPWKKDLDPSTLTLQDFRDSYASLQPLLKPALLEYVWKRQDFPKKDRMGFLVDVLQNEQSLNALEYAGRYFTEGAGLQLKPLAVQEMLAWWADNQNNIQ
jgi:hypothetical protein